MPDRKLFADEIEARLDALLLLALRQRSAAAVACALEPWPRSAQERVLHWVAVAAQNSTELGMLLATCAAAHTEAPEPFDAWALTGLNGFDRGGLVAAETDWAEFSVKAKSRRWWHGAAFIDMEPRLTRLLQALSGHAPELAIGPSPLTDTETLWLPAQLAVMADAETNQRLYMAITALLWAQTRFGTFELNAETAFAQCVDPAPVLAWLAVFEAMRLEARIAAELPGLGDEIARLRGPWPEALARIARELAQPAAGVAASFAYALAQVKVDGEHAPFLPYGFVLDFARVAATARRRNLGGAKGGARSLNVIRGAGGRGQQNPDMPPLMAADDGRVADTPADSASVPAEGGAQEAPPSAPPSAPLSPSGLSAWQPVAGAAESAAETMPERAPDALYDEWDYRRKAWRRNWCHLYETEAPAGDIAWVQAVRHRHSHLIRSIRRRFEHLRGEDRIHRRQLEGEELDLDAQVEAHADRRNGIEPSPRQFCQRRRSERSLAVMFMVDMSGSTKGWVNDAEREALVLLCEAIEALGDRYAIYGFSGWTRTRCDIYRIKPFDARYDADTQARIAGIEARDYTRMGVAVRHLSGLLAAQAARHKLLVTLSDGRPDDYGDEYRGHYGIEDTRRALHQARAAGIRSYCVTIDRHGADYLPQLYGPAHFTVIDDAKKLPQRLAEIYRKLTA
jgi:nitric oxide reductase NorD protein